MLAPRMLALTALISLICLSAILVTPTRASETRVPVIFTGGHETDPRDGGRPVVLVAAALGVTPEVFRAAFSGVTPARNDKPSREDLRRNKAILMKALKPHRVTIERLDEVSDYYRYKPQTGKLWKATPAEAYAIVEGGVIKKVVLTAAGSGYNSTPVATVEGVAKTELEVTLKFGKELETNGSIGSVEVIAPTPSR